MTALNLSSKKVNQATANQIAEFVYNNRESLSNELKVFYQDVKGFIEMQLKKAPNRRMTMTQVLERAYNIEAYVLASGAASYETIFVSK